MRRPIAAHVDPTHTARHTEPPPLTAGCREEENVGSYSVFLRFTIAMVVVPMITMYITSQHVLDRIFTFSTNGNRMAYAGIVAIVSVQFVIAAFLVYAFKEDPRPKAKSS